MSITVMKQALELLMVATFNSPELQAKRTEVINAGLAAIEQAEKQEPVARRTTREEKIVRPGIYEVMRDVLSATPPAAPVQE